MLHPQESRISSSQVNFKLLQESTRSDVSALLSRLNSSTPRADNAEKEKCSGDEKKTKEQKMQDTFPWMPGFSSLCQTTVGSRNVKALESLMNKYLENVTPSVKYCYRANRKNRAHKLKKNMKDMLIFFHLFYQEVKEALDRSSYLDLMTPLVSMFIDMEIKVYEYTKKSVKKVTSRLTSSLYLFLDNSEEHMLDAVIMTKYINKKNGKICAALLQKLLNNISNRKDDIFYLRYLLIFKLWKKIADHPKEKNRISETAVQKLPVPQTLLENGKAYDNILPNNFKLKKNITLFLMQSNFNLKDACQEFLKLVKKRHKTVYSQNLDYLDIDKPLFFMGDIGSDAHLLSEKNVEVDSGHNSVDLCSSISVDSIASPSDMVKELSSDQALGVEMTIGSKKKRNLGKKVEKGKKKLKVNSGTKAKKKKKLKNSESIEFKKGNKKANKLKAKRKKKKKLCQVNDLSSVKQSIPLSCDQIKVKQTSSQDEVNQLAVTSSSAILKEDPDQANEKSPVSVMKQDSQLNVKLDLTQPEESVIPMLAQAVPPVHQECKENKVEKSAEEPTNANEVGKKQSQAKMVDYKLFVKSALLLASDQIKMEEGTVRLLDVSKTEKEKACSLYENSKSDLYADKPKDMFNKEVSIPADHHKTEKMETSLVSSKLLETTLASNVAETLVKKEKADVVSTACVASQCDLNESVSSEIKEQVTAHQVSSVSIEKKPSKDAEYRLNKLTEESVLPVDDLASKSDSNDQSDKAFDDQVANLFIVEKPKDKSNDAKNHLDLPKTEKLEIPLSSPILKISISNKADEPLVKKENMEVASNIFVRSVDSQFDLKDKMSTEREQVTASQGSSINFEKEVNDALEYDKPCILTGESVLSSDDLVSKHDNKNKADILLDNQRPNLLILEKYKDELKEEVENISVPISLVVEDRDVNGYEKTKAAENAVPVSMYLVGMGLCNPSIKEVCDNSEATETSIVPKGSPMNTDSDVEILEEHQETGKCAASPSVLGDDGHPYTQNIFNTENSHVVTDILDSHYSCQQNVIPADAAIPFGAQLREPVYDPYLHKAGSCDTRDILCSKTINKDDPCLGKGTLYVKTINKDDPCLGKDISCPKTINKEDPGYFWDDEWIKSSSGTQVELELPMMEYLSSLCVNEEDEGSPKSFEASTPKKGMGKMSYTDIMSEKESKRISYGWNSSNVLPINSSESGNSGSSTPRSESGTDSGEGVGLDTLEECDSRSVKSVERSGSSDHISDENNFRFYDSLPINYIRSSEIMHTPKESFIFQSSYVPKVGDSHSSCSPLVMENVEDSTASKQSSRDSSRLEILSSVPDSFCENVSTSVELSSSRRKKLYLDERIDSQMASGKPVSRDSPVVQPGAQSSDIPVIPCPSSTHGDTTTHETQQKTDGLKDPCICAECTVGSLMVSASSYGSTREGPPTKKMKSSSKMHPDETIDSRITGKQVSGEFSMGQGRPSVRGMLSESNIPGKSSHYSTVMLPFSSSTVPYTQSTVTSSITPNIPSLSYPYTSAGVITTQGRPQLKSALDFLGWNCNLSNCSLLSSSDSKAYPYIPKPSNYETPNWKSSNKSFSEKGVHNSKLMSDKLIDKTENEWKSPNEELLKKIEESLKNTKYDLKSETSLPLKKRLKKATISYESAANKIVSKAKTNLESFPSYPTTPMMSLAQIDFKENVFVRAWTESKPNLEGSRNVNHEICSTVSCPNPLYLSNQPNLALQTSSYATSLVKGVQRNSAHCGKCAEKAVSSVCESALYNSASSAGQVNPSSNVATYSCTSSPSTKVNVSSYDSQQSLNSQYYSVSSKGHYGVQQSTPVDCSSFKPENAQCDNKSKVSESISNQSLSKNNTNLNVSAPRLLNCDFKCSSYACVTDVGVTQQRFENPASMHVEKQRQPEVEEPFQAEGELEVGEEVEVGEELEVGGEIEVGEEVEVGGEEEMEEEEEGDEEAEGKEAPKYSIVQKSSPDSEEDANKGTTRIMPFRIFLNKNKNRKVLSKKSCSKCRMVDCKGDCHSSSSEVDGSLANSDHENNDDISEPKSHRKRGRKSRSSRDGDECIRKSKRRKHPHPLEDSEYVMQYDKKRRRKHISR